jgi:cytochrome P450
VLAHSDTFTKSRFARRLLHRVLGGGLLVAEGAPHRAQRRVLNPAFGPVQVRELSGIFLDKANEVRHDVVTIHPVLPTDFTRD